MLEFLPTVSSLILLLVTTRDLVKNRYLIVLNPFFWVSFFSFFYLVLPSFFVNEINFYYQWRIDYDSILLSNFITFVYVFFLSIFYFFCSSDFKAFASFKAESNISLIIKFLWFLITIYLIVALYLSYKDFNFIDAFSYDGTQLDPFKIKNLVYILITISSLFFLAVRKLWVFIPNLIVIVIDLLNGSRTTAFVALVPIALCLCIVHKKLFFTQAAVLFFGMLLLGVIRSDNVVSDVPWYINALGEFRETYITLPIMIQNYEYISHGGFFDLAAGIGVGVLHPFRAEIADNYLTAGFYIADIISRGYGLGSNVIIESLFYGYYGFVFLLASFCFFLVSGWLIVRKSSISNAAIASCFSVVLIRIAIREGLPASMALGLFIYVFYCLPFLVFNKINCSPK